MRLIFKTVATLVALFSLLSINSVQAEELNLPGFSGSINTTVSSGVSIRASERDCRLLPGWSYTAGAGPEAVQAGEGAAALARPELGPAGVGLDGGGAEQLRQQRVGPGLPAHPGGTTSAGSVLAQETQSGEGRAGGGGVRPTGYGSQRVPAVPRRAQLDSRCRVLGRSWHATYKNWQSSCATKRPYLRATTRCYRSVDQ